MLEKIQNELEKAEKHSSGATPFDNGKLAKSICGIPAKPSFDDGKILNFSPSDDHVKGSLWALSVKKRDISNNNAFKYFAREGLFRHVNGQQVQSKVSN